MKKVLIIPVCLMILVTTMGSGCLEPTGPLSNYYSYSIKITAEKSVEFTIYAPFVDEFAPNNTKDNLFSNINAVLGSGQYSIIQTVYGLALKIESYDTLHLECEYEDPGDYIPLTLSMQVSDLVGDLKDHRIYCDGKEQMELRVSITLEARAGECCAEYRSFETDPQSQSISTQGWQTMTAMHTILD